jgi:hypothetical protein
MNMTCKSRYPVVGSLFDVLTYYSVVGSLPRVLAQAVDVKVLNTKNVQLFLLV